MKIESSNISLISQHASSRQAIVEESLRAWVEQQRPDFEGNRTRNNTAPIQQTIATISAAGRQAAANTQTIINTQAPADNRAASETEDNDSLASNDPKIRFLINLIEALTGKKVKIFNPDDLKPSHTPQCPPQQAAVAQPTSNQRQGWGIEYDRHETVHESEQTSFNAQGVIKTSDGKAIQFQLSVDMQREFSEEINVSIRKGDGVKKDPLVINFNGTAAQVSIPRQSRGL